MAERDLAEAIEDGKREAPKRMVDGELVPDERHLPSVEIWQSARDRKGERIWHNVLPLTMSASGFVIAALAPYRLSFSKYVAAAEAARRDPFFALDAA